MHWADVLAEELFEKSSHHVLATAITPSGPIHLGNLREILTTEAVHRSLLRRGAESRLLFIADSYDPLRKVYPFLDPNVYSSHVGKPLSEIPCPCLSHPSYAHHFLEPFLLSLEELGVRPEVLMAHEMYGRGDYQEAIETSLENASTIREILERVAQREGKLPPNWIPFHVQCARCRRLTGPVVTLWEPPIVEYRCLVCNHEGSKDVRIPGEGKLPWRVDWPARWKFLEVTFEAMGKDHAAAGSSWDTGVEISKRVFGRPPPHRTVYEFVHVRGVGAMHSSTGTALAAEEMLRMTPPEVVRFLFMRAHPSRHIEFDPGSWVVDLVSEYDRWEHAYFTQGPEARKEASFKDLDRTLELSQPSGSIPKVEPPRIPYAHLVLLLSIKGSWEEIERTLQRTRLLPPNPSSEAIAHLQRRIEHARYWLSKYAPEEYRFRILDHPPRDLVPLSENERGFLRRLRDLLSKESWTPESIHSRIYEASSSSGVPPPRAFEILYTIFLGRPRGPRAGYLLSSLPPEEVLRRIEEAFTLP